MTRNKISATEARNLRRLLLLDVFAPEEIGARIQKAREEAGLRQEDLADLVELSTRQVQNLEAGVSKPYKHLKAIAEVTNRPFDWFLHGDEEKSPEQQPSTAELAVDLRDLREVVERVAETQTKMLRTLETISQEVARKRRPARTRAPGSPS